VEDPYRATMPVAYARAQVFTEISANGIASINFVSSCTKVRSDLFPLVDLGKGSDYVQMRIMKRISRILHFLHWCSKLPFFLFLQESHSWTYRSMSLCILIHQYRRLITSLVRLPPGWAAKIGLCFEIISFTKRLGTTMVLCFSISYR
jgi:hypothetical protein